MSNKKAKTDKKPKISSTSNKKPQEKREPLKAKTDKKPEQVPKEPLKASTVVTANDVAPLDPGTALKGPQKPPPGPKKTRGPDKQPRKPRIDFNPPPEPEPVPEIAPQPEQEILVVDVMAAARVTTNAFVKSFDILFCGWCPPRLTKSDEKLLIELWTPIVYENNNQIPAWVPAGLVTLGIMGDRIIRKFN